MSSRSSSSGRRPLAIGRVAGFRGRSGEITVRIASGSADRWEAVGRVLIDGPETGGRPRSLDVERARAYRDRLVLKLRGIDDPSQGDSLRGATVLVPPHDLPELEDDEYFAAELIGFRVESEISGATLGEVVGLVPTGGTDVLVVRDPGGHELLIPMAREVVVEIRGSTKTMRVRPPAGLLELNRTKDET